MRVEWDEYGSLVQPPLRSGIDLDVPPMERPESAAAWRRRRTLFEFRLMLIVSVVSIAIIVIWGRG